MTTTMPRPRLVRFLKYSIDPTHGPADVCHIMCIDWRWWNPIGKNPKAVIVEFWAKKGWKAVPIDAAGGIKLLADTPDNPTDEILRAGLVARVHQELGLHHPHILAISVHRDCGGYGYSKAFGNDYQKETDRLCEDLWTAKQFCEKEFGAKVRVECYIFDTEGVEEVLF